MVNLYSYKVDPEKAFEAGLDNLLWDLDLTPIDDEDLRHASLVEFAHLADTKYSAHYMCNDTYPPDVEPDIWTTRYCIRKANHKGKHYCGPGVTEPDLKEVNWE